MPPPAAASTQAALYGSVSLTEWACRRVPSRDFVFACVQRLHVFLIQFEIVYLGVVFDATEQGGC